MEYINVPSLRRKSVRLGIRLHVTARDDNSFAIDQLPPDIWNNESSSVSGRQAANR